MTARNDTLVGPAVAPPPAMPPLPRVGTLRPIPERTVRFLHGLFPAVTPSGNGPSRTANVAATQTGQTIVMRVTDRLGGVPLPLVMLCRIDQDEVIAEARRRLAVAAEQAGGAS